MNNSRIAIDRIFDEPKEIDYKPQLRQREGELVKIIEALKNVQSSKDWSTLKNTVFDGVVTTLETQLHSEAIKQDPDKLVMARINGQRAWAKKYANLDNLAEIFRLELTQVRLKLYGKTQENS